MALHLNTDLESDSLLENISYRVFIWSNQARNKATLSFDGLSFQQVTVDPDERKCVSFLYRLILKSQ